MSEDAVVPELPESPTGLYHLCSACAGEGDGCLACFDSGLQPHCCGEDE